MSAAAEGRLYSDIAPTCPHLGSRRDRAVYYSYPSNGNRCYRGGPEDVPSDAHQSAYCLTKAYAECPVYRAEDGAPFPDELRAFHAARRSAGLRGLRWVAVVVGLGLLVEAWLYLAPRLRAPAPVPATEPTVEAVVPAPSETTVPATNSPEPSATPVSTETASPQAHVLEEPIIVDGREFQIHRVAWGETFESLSAGYDTTQEVIRALNFNLVPPLRADSVIVIAPGMQTPDATLPAFQVKEVDEAETTIDGVASELGVDPILLARYNRCESGCRLVAGDWLLVPVGP